LGCHLHATTGGVRIERAQACCGRIMAILTRGSRRAEARKTKTYLAINFIVLTESGFSISGAPEA
jgi:hypothetical protein